MQDNSDAFSVSSNSTTYSDRSSNMSVDSDISTDSGDSFSSNGESVRYGSDGKAYDGNGHPYSDYKEYFEIANLDPEKNYKSKACRKASRAYERTERQISIIRKKYENMLNKAEKDFKKTREDLIKKFKDRGPEFFKNPGGEFYKLPQVAEHVTKINKIRNKMDSKIRLQENAFLAKMNSKKKAGHVVDVMKRNDTYLYIEAQDKGLSNPEDYTISGRKEKLLKNGDLFNSYINEKDPNKKDSLWEMIKKAVNAYLFGDKVKKDNIIEQMLEKLRQWLNNDKEVAKIEKKELPRKSLEDFFAMVAERKNEERLWMKENDYEKYYQSETKVNNKFDRAERKFQGVNSDKLSNDKASRYEKEIILDHDREQNLKRAVGDKNKEMDNKQEVKDNQLDSAKVGNVNAEKLSSDKSDRVDVGTERDSVIKNSINDIKNDNKIENVNNVEKDNVSDISDDETIIYNDDDFGVADEEITANITNNIPNINIKIDEQSVDKLKEDLSGPTISNELNKGSMNLVDVTKAETNNISYKGGHVVANTQSKGMNAI